MFLSPRLLIWRKLLSCVALAFSFCALAGPRINEFMAANDTGLKDEDGEFSDWIEIFNPDATPVSLTGYYLTDNPQNLAKWKFPAMTLNPGAYLVVFASGKDRTNPTGKLHTSFQLDADRDYLALVAPDKTSILTEFSPWYPPQFDDVSYGYGSNIAPPVWSFFSTASPGAVNPAGTRAGPVITASQKNPPQPAGDPLTVTAQIRPLNGPIAGANLIYRRMFNSETNIIMRDDGTSGDTNANDGIWTALIPAGAFAPGEMTRWRFTATDSTGTQTKEPAFRNTIDYPQYFGTVALDSRIQSLLPVFHWFTTNLNSSGTDAGARGSAYYEGEFYDNIFFSLHGQSTAGFPKKSYNIDFNPHNHFRYKTNAARVSDIDLLTNWADKSKVRHVLAYEIMREAGVAAHFAFTVRVQMNGTFFSTADFVERGNEDYLERAGLNKDGALYKVYDNSLNKAGGDTGTRGVEKKNRTFEGNADLQALIDGLALTGTNLVNYLWDNIDIPRCVDMLAANSVVRNIDMHRKNWYIYRDTGRSGEWAILPWDLDLSQGRVWNVQNTYFDNGIYTDGFVVSGDSIRLVALLFQNQAMRSMIMRRIRSLTDEFLQPPPAPGTPESALFYERRLNEQSALLDPSSIVPSDATRDFQKWGSWLTGGTTVPYTNTDPAVESMAEAIQRFKTEYLPQRRAYIYNTQIVGKGGEIPLPQDSSSEYVYTPLVVTGAAAKAIVPTNSNLGLNWIGLTSQEPYNTSAWLSGTTGVGYERGTGYGSLIGLNVDNAMKSNNSVYIRVEFDVANPAAFEKLELRVKFDDGFVAFLNGTILASSNSPASLGWNSAATANREANAALFDVFDITSKKSSLRAGKNILAIQGLNDSTNSTDMLIVPELYGAVLGASTRVEPKINFGAYEVSPISGNQDQEYIELVNTNSIAIDMSDWHIIGGIEHDFVPGTVIPARSSLYICPKAEAFRARAVSPKGGQGLFVQGGYRDHLSNLGETIMLVDSTGATNATLAYTGQPSDPQNYLVVSELMYHPPGDGLAEYIEVMNISPTVTLSLSDIRFTQGVLFNFNDSRIKSLAPGALALVVRDVPAFEAIYGTNLPIAGVFTNNTALDNSGEHIKLEDPDNQTILEFTYSDVAPWPTAPARLNYSLTLIAPETKPNPALGYNWRASAFLRGSPGASDATALPANPTGDANGNGQPDLLDYALGNNLGTGPIPPSLASFPDPSGEGVVLALSYPQSVGADRAKIDVLSSTDFTDWQLATTNLLRAGATKQLGDGRVLLSWIVQPAAMTNTQTYLRLRVTPR
ncbi:MAG TPA: CotH kinase family protein [Verrucomicrobiae bacterium]|nr:CotH kinase family protein [Verrucomicrobiae bacterium]